MGDYIAYLILAVVFIWYCRSTYKKIKGESGNCGSSGGCGGCSTTSDVCDGEDELFKRRLE